MTGSYFRMRVKAEHLVYAAAFLAALALRLVGAAQFPLTDREAVLALQALALSRGQSPLLDPHALYLALTALLFSVFTPAAWTARFWPALAGSGLVLLPALYRERIGRFPAALLAIFLAFDPGLLAVSRMAGSQALALFLTLLALGLWLKRRPTLAGAAAGLALLSGPGIWPGALGLLAAGWLTGRPRRAPAPDLSAPAVPEPADAIPSASPIRQAVFAALVTLFFSGTLFFLIPSGLSAAGQSLPAYLSGWLPGSAAAAGLPFGLFLLSLLLYEFFPLIFGLWHAGWSFTRGAALPGPSRTVRFLVIWGGVALLLALVYPARQLADVTWALIPWWALAARQIARLVTLPSADRLPVMGQAVLASVILAFISMGLVTLANVPSTDSLQNEIQLGGALVMLAASAGLVAWGWSRRVAMRGLSWGLGLLLLVYFLAAGWNAAGLAGRARDELWSGGPRIRSADLILATLKNLDQWNGPHTSAPNIAVVGVASPALRWLLRDVAQVSYPAALTSASSPAVVITPLQPQLSLAASYRGEAFVLDETVNWQQIKLADWVRWQVFRALPDTVVQQNKIILWARNDLFPGGAAQLITK